MATNTPIEWDRGNVEPRCGLHRALARMHELLRHASRRAPRSDGAAEVHGLNAAFRRPSEVERPNQSDRASLNIPMSVFSPHAEHPAEQRLDDPAAADEDLRKLVDQIASSGPW